MKTRPPETTGEEYSPVTCPTCVPFAGVQCHCWTSDRAVVVVIAVAAGLALLCCDAYRYADQSGAAAAASGRVDTAASAPANGGTTAATSATPAARTGMRPKRA